MPSVMIPERRTILIMFLLGSGALSPALARAETVFRINLDPLTEESIIAAEVSGTVELQPSAAENASAGERCFYLPYNDPSYYYDPTNGNYRQSTRDRDVEKIPGVIDVTGASTGAAIVRIAPWLVKVAAPSSGPFRLRFQSRLPQWPRGSVRQRIYHEFHPVPVSDCSHMRIERWGRDRDRTLLTELRLSAPLQWTLDTGQTVRGRRIEHDRQYLTVVSHGFQPAVILTRDMQTRLLNYRGTPVQLIYFDPTFLDIFNKSVAAWDLFARVLGETPHSGMIFLETEDLESPLLPGIVTMNRPRQLGLTQLERLDLNWTTWQLVFNIGNQWLFGRKRYDMDRFWFFIGTVDFLTYLYLRDAPEGGDLVAEDSHLREKFGFSFNYRQSEDISAMMAIYYNPRNHLVDMAGGSPPYEQQHSTGYIRHSLALRYLSWYLGAERLFGLLHDYFTGTADLAAPLDPLTLHDYLHELFQAGGLAAGQDPGALLLRWWQADGWPDFALAETRMDAGTLSVYVNQPAAFQLPVDVHLTRGDGTTETRLAVLEDGRWVARFAGEERPRRIEINPDREIFDENRFNNADGLPKIAMFPPTLYDDSHMLWLAPPYPYQHPGEPLTWSLWGLHARYVHGFTLANVILVPSNRYQGGWFLAHGVLLPRLASVATLNVYQDYGAFYRNERMVELALDEINMFNTRPYFWGGALRRHIALAGPGGVQDALLLRGGLKSTPTTGERNADFRLEAVVEKSLWPTAGGSSYLRRYMIGNQNWTLWQCDLSLREFSGALDMSGPPSGNTRFLPTNLDEARIRLVKQPADAARLTSLNVDFASPLVLPLPAASFVLVRNTRMRLFFDYGLASDLVQGEYEAGGAGFYLPFGGDVSGSRTVRVGGLNLLVVLHQRYDGEKVTRPGFLFDFGRKL